MDDLAVLIGAIAWPGVVIWALWYFQEPVRALLGRGLKVRAGPAEIEVAADQQSSAEAAKALAAPEPPAAVPIDPHPIYSETDQFFEDRIRKISSDPESMRKIAERWLSIAWFQHFA